MSINPFHSKTDSQQPNGYYQESGYQNNSWSDYGNTGYGHPNSQYQEFNQSQYQGYQKTPYQEYTALQYQDFESETRGQISVLTPEEKEQNRLAYEEKKRVEMENRIAPMAEGMIFADNLINRSYLSNLSEYDILQPEKDEDFASQMTVYRLTRLIYEEGEDINEKLVSVYGALHNIKSRVFLLLDADQHGIQFYIGTAIEKQSAASSLAAGVLEDSIKGNFPGSIRAEESDAKLSTPEIKRMMEETFSIGKTNPFGKDKNIAASLASVTMIPSERGQDKQSFVQGLEKLINALQGKKYTAMFLAVPLEHDVIDARKSGLEYLYSTLSPMSKTTFSYGENVSKAVSEGISTSFANSINTSVTDSNSENHSISKSITRTKGTADTFGTSTSSGTSSSSSEPGIFGGSENLGMNSSYGTNRSHSTNRSTSKTEGVTSGESFSHSVTTGISETRTDGETETITDTMGENRSFTINYENKTLTGIMDHIQDHLKRIKLCESFGLWDCSAYFLAEGSVAMTAASMYHSLMTGETSQIEKSFVNYWDNAKDKGKINAIKTYLMQGYHPLMELPAMKNQSLIQSQLVSPAAMVSGKELPLLLSFPRSSVTGIMVDNIASFGRSVILSGKKPEREIELGAAMHKGEVDKDNRVNLDLDLFTSHCFITGSTGSGKSNTTSQLLGQFIKKKTPFLVIEPAKGEYKIDFGNTPGINIFWTNPNDFQMLRLNPFRFPEEIHVLEHLDRLIEMFSACWPLTAAMPAMLKDTMERAYEVCGWDMAKSICLNSNGPIFPTFAVVQKQLEYVIDSSSYSQEAKGDYKGALGTRIRSLTRGIMGQVFCAKNDICDEVLFDENTIVDLSRVGSTETKSLIMGILIMKLNEYRSAKATPETQNSGLRHVTILEEAHNLLRRVAPGAGSDVQAKSIEMICNGIAEMRTYGEGFLIIDQSPTAVDISAIKNTNTKIVMRLPEESDFTTIGGAFSLNEVQIREIPRLGKGEAIVSQSGWLQPVLTKIDYAGKTVKDYKYQKKPVDQRKVRQTMAKLCVKLCRQLEAGCCGSALTDESENILDEAMLEYREILSDSTLTLFKQQEMLETIGRYLTGYQPEMNNNPAELGKIMIELLDCNGLYHTIRLQFREPKGDILTDEDKERYYRWQKCFLNGMKWYAEFETKKDKIHIFRLMRSYMIKTDIHFNKLKRTGAIQ